MKPGTKAAAIGIGTGLSTPGMVETIHYLWTFTTHPPLPENTAIMIAGLLAALLYRIFPQSDRNVPT